MKPETYTTVHSLIRVAIERKMLIQRFGIVGYFTPDEFKLFHYEHYQRTELCVLVTPETALRECNTLIEQLQKQIVGINEYIAESA